MRRKVFFYSYLLIVFLALASCGVNIFNSLMPTDPKNVSDVNTLVQMGDNKMNLRDYPGAFEAYSKAMQLDPKNSLAIEGACTAYTLNKIPYSNIIINVIATNLTNFNLQDIYDVSGFVGNHLYKIIDKQADGVIPYNDISVNLNFFIYNSIYAQFNLADSDKDGNITGDTNDFLIIQSNWSYSNNFSTALGKATNSLVEVLSNLQAIFDERDVFTNRMDHSYYSLFLVTNQLLTTNAIDYIVQINSNINSNDSVIRDMFSNLANDAITSNIIVPPTPPSAITLLLTGYAPNPGGYDTFTNDLYAATVTNFAGMTNTVPDLNNYIGFIGTYFGIASF